MLSLDRVNPLPLLRGHWKSLADVRAARRDPDWIARGLLLATLALFPAAWLLGWTLRTPQPLLAGVALLGGALLGAFGQLNTLRIKLTDRAGEDDEATKIDRDAFDESAAHLLTASMLCGVTAFLLVVGINVTDCPNGAVTGFWAAAAIATASYTLLTFLMALPRLYSAYVRVNKVSDEVNGFVRGKP